MGGLEFSSPAPVECWEGMGLAACLHPQPQEAETEDPQNKLASYTT